VTLAAAVTLARRSWVEVVYDSKDISADLAPYLLGTTYIDNKGGKADEVSLELQDREGLWRGDWLPGTGDTVEVRIHADEWGEGGGSLFCGTFTVDKLGLSGPPSKVTLGGVSVPTGLAARKTKRSRAWESATLATIAADVAASARMTLVWDAPDGEVIDRVDQSSETDLAFLGRMCDAYNLALKVTDGQLVVWDLAVYAAKDEVVSYTLGESRIISWSLEVKAFLSIPRVKVIYSDPVSGTLQECTQTATEDPDDPLGLSRPVMEEGILGELGVEAAPAIIPQSFDVDATEVIRKRARSKAEAEALAKARLAATQSHQAEGSLNVVGDVRLVAGNSIRLAGWNKLDGKYLIETATHAVSGGYTVGLKIKRSAA